MHDCLQFRAIVGQSTFLLCPKAGIHLLFKHFGHRIQLRCKGDLPVQEHIYMNAQLPLFHHLTARLQVLQDLHIWCKKVPRRGKGKAGINEKLLQCLIAFDANSEGKSYRQIAELLYGKDVVRRDWGVGNSYLKSRVIRRVKRGQYYVDGGYRDLLK